MKRRRIDLRARETSGRLRGTFRRVLAAAVAFFLPCGAALACPLCKESVRENSETLAASYNVSTLVMLGGLFSLFGFSVFLFVRAARQPSFPAGSAPREPSAPPSEESR